MASRRQQSWPLDIHDHPARAARHHVAEIASAWGLPERRDAAELLVSELVTNSCVHARPPITLTLALVTTGTTDPPRLLIEVTDGLPTPPRKKTPGDTGGFGLGVIESLADLSVIIHHPTGKTVRALLKPA